MPIAPYSLDTISRMINLAGAGNGPTAIGVTLGWPKDRVERIAAKHGVDLPKDREPKTEPEPTRPAQPQRQQRQQRRPRYDKKLKDHPRTECVSIAISRSGRALLEQIAKARGKSASGTVAVTVDYALRHGLLGDMADTAFAELEEERA